MKTLKDIKKLVKLDDHHNYGDIFRKVSELVETDKTLRSERKDLETLLSANTDFRAGIFDTVVHLLSERDGALTLRESYNSNVEDWRELCSYFNLPVSELSSVMKAIDTMRLERDMLRVTAAQPQLNEIRYVLHGDIQPCTVLYNDDTTTLLRLDEGDIMCETDTIEWSDSVTYRCQELLRGFVGLTVSAKFTHHTMHAASAAMAQLVRDERILLNDDELEADNDTRHSPSSEQQHDMAKHSSVTPIDPREEPSNPEDTWACVKCTHRFPTVRGRCPKCNTPTREWTDNNSPTPLR